MKKKFTSILMVIAITVFTFMPYVNVNAEPEEGTILRKTTTNYHTTVEFIGEVKNPISNNVIDNLEKTSDSIDANYDEEAVTSIVDRYKGEFNTKANTKDIDGITYDEGEITSFYYDVHDEINQYDSCPAEFTEYAGEECIVIDTVLDKHQTYTVKGTANLKTYTVSFDTNGGSSVPSQQVVSGDRAVEPTEPTRDGYELMYWLSNDYKYIYDEITANTTFYAQWIRKFNITKGAELTFYLESDKDITIVADGPLNEFEGFMLFSDNSAPIDMTNLTEGTDYVLEEGSTKITLKNSFLKTLAVDKYYVEFYYYNPATYGSGYTDSILYVKEGSEPVTAEATSTSSETTTLTSNPQTGDNIMFYISLLGLSTISLIGVGIYTTKKKLFN